MEWAERSRPSSDDTIPPDAITYTCTLPPAEAYLPLFLSTGWNDEYQLSDDRLHESIRRSWLAVCAYDGDRLLGLGRVISDGILHALRVDLIVLPEYRGRGIGSALLMRLVRECQTHGIPDIQLFCAKGQAGFFLKHGFAARPNTAPGMQYVGQKR